MILPLNFSVADTKDCFTLEKYSKGMRHSEIDTLQSALQNAGTFKQDKTTNYFGSITKKAVEEFQKKNGLIADGIVGKATLAMIMELGLLDEEEKSSILDTLSDLDTASRGKSQTQTQYGEYIEWSDMRNLIDKGTSTMVIKDFYTGKTFNLLASYGSNHVDVETLTKEDTAVVKELWGESFSWARRPVLVYYKDRVFAASLNGMPHAGIESKPEGEYVSNRSGGFGYGYNYDSIKGNDFEGVICLHFKGSKLHKNNKSDSQHQKSVRIAAGLE